VVRLRQAQELVDPGDLTWRSAALYDLGSAYADRGELERGAEVLAEAIAAAEEANNLGILLRASHACGQLRESQGALREAERLYHAALAYARGRRCVPMPLAGVIFAGLGRLSYQRNDLSGARAHLREALGRTTSELAVPDPRYAFVCYVEILRIQSVLGDAAGAGALFQHLASAARRAGARYVEPVVAVLRVQRPEATDEEVGAWLAAFEARTRGETQLALPTSDCCLPDIGSLEIVTWARLRLAQGQTELIVARLDRFLETMVQQGRHGSVLPVRTLLATLYWQTQRRDRAVAVLEPALALAEREGYVRVFLEAGGALAPVLRTCEARGIAPVWSGRLLAALSERRQSIGEACDGADPALLEPLSEREMEVLRLTAAGLSNETIAEHLFLAVGTVKRHLHNINAKLAVTSRIAAVARARAMRLF
jgi:LuxR family transcriptional regulator, maltose regulon positive regulatory protein